MIEMIAGAARELVVGDPRDIATHVGPVIDAEAKEQARRRGSPRMQAAGSLSPGRRRAAGAGTFVPPAIIALDRARDLTEEVFGPVLHVVRWRAGRARRAARRHRGQRLRADARHPLAASTTRPSASCARLANGNVYVNRNMIGAVVGTQPFGGTGLSGTGPKAGGPNYLRRFATEQIVTVNTAAAGGNATLLADRR